MQDLMKPRILLFALADWVGPTRLPYALRLAGFELALLADQSGLIAKSRHFEYRYELAPAQVRLGRIGPILRAIRDFQPRMVVPCDEAAAHVLQSLAVAWDGGDIRGRQFRTRVPGMIREVLLRSLGDPRFYPIRTSRKQARRAAEALGIAVPPSTTVPYQRIAEGFADDHGWPVVLTREGRATSDQVRVCHDRAELARAYAELTQSSTGGGNGLRGMLAKAYWTLRTGFHLTGDLTRPRDEGPLLHVETLLEGRGAIYSMVAWEGRALAGFAALSETIHPAASGAASVVRLVEDDAIREAARKLAARFGFSGFAGIDFMRDAATDQLWFLKFNPRPTALAHLGQRAGNDLGQALMGQISNAFPTAPQPVHEMTVALYPQDWLREPDDSKRVADYFDIPVDDDRLAAALRRMIPAQAKVNAKRAALPQTTGAERKHS